MPQTTEEFEAMLRAFKTRDANRNGNPNDEIPFSADPDNLHLAELCGWFGLSVYSSRDLNEGLTMEKGRLEFGANREEYKTGIKYLANLNAQGLFDPELFTQDKNQWRAKGEQDRYGVIVTYHSGDVMPFDPGVIPDWEAMPVLTSPQCGTPVFLRDSYGSDVLKTQVVITDKARDPAAIARWWDNLYEYENTLQSQHGPLGITLFKETGGYRKIDTSVLASAVQEQYDWNNLFPQSLPKYDPDGGYRVLEEVPMYREKEPADARYDPYLTETIPPFWATNEEATRLSDLQTAISAYVRQKRAEWISGQSSIDADWDTYLRQLERLQVREYVELRRRLIR
jgi:putative aldouronate transport system substrate-binding protein